LPQQFQTVPTATDREPSQTIIVIDEMVNQNEQCSDNDNMIIDVEHKDDHDVEHNDDHDAQPDIQLNLDDYLLADNDGKDRSVSE